MKIFPKKKKGNTWSWLFHFPIIIFFRHASSSDFFLYFSMLMVLPVYPFFFFWTLATTYGLLRVHIDVILFVCCTYRCCLFRYDFATCLLLFFFFLVSLSGDLFATFIRVVMSMYVVRRCHMSNYGPERKENKSIVHPCQDSHETLLTKAYY